MNDEITLHSLGLANTPEMMSLKLDDLYKRETEGSYVEIEWIDSSFQESLSSS